MNGANNRENPVGVPRFRKVIRVAPLPGGAQCTWSPSETDLPRSASRADGRERTQRFHTCRRCGGRESARRMSLGSPRAKERVFHSTDLIFTYHSGAFVGSAAYAATWSEGNALVIREAAVSTSEQNGVRQSLAGIVVGEKNPCLQVADSPAGSRLFSTGFCELAETISGQNWDKPVPRKSKRIVYSGFSPR